MTVITDEQICSTVRKVDLHANQTIRMTRQMVEGDALAEVKRPLVESLPIPVPPHNQLLPIKVVSTM